MSFLIFDILVLIIILVSVISYFSTNSIYKKYKKIDNIQNLSGSEVAEKILSKNNLDNVYVVETKYILEQGYDSNRKVIRLPKDVFDGTSISDMLLSAIECSAAIEHKNGNSLLKLRNLLIPIINIITYISYIGIVASSILRDFKFLRYSLITLGITVIVQLLFISLERRKIESAISYLKEDNMLSDDEANMIDDKVINTLSYKYIGYPIILIIALINFIKSKFDN